MKSEFRPCIDLHNGRVKQIVGSTLNSSSRALQTNFVSEKPPEYFAELYAKDQLTGGHVIQLGPGNQEAARRALGAWPGHLQLGGGVNNTNASSWIDAGAQKVIVTSFVFCEGALQMDRVRAMVRAVGKERLVLDLSCRRTKEGKYFVVTDCWQNFTTLEIDEKNLEMLTGFSSEFLIHAVDIEGKQSGIDPELLTILADHAPIPCVYAGGISSFEDVERIEECGKGKIHYTIGSALDIFGGRLPYQEVVKRAKQN